MTVPAQPVDALLRQLTLDEKIDMLCQDSPGVARLGIAPFRTGSEVLHGVCGHGPATVFPQAVGLGATWSPELLERIGVAVATELRALHNARPEIGLNVWGPVVNLLRDPRWGRNEEGYSEDPHLTSTLAIAYCRGLRGEGTGNPVGDDGPEFLLTAPTLKHFLAYNREENKTEWSAGIRPRVLWEYDIRPFLDPVRAGVVSAVMPTYTAVNGRPQHLGGQLSILRAANPQLVAVTDSWAVTGIVDDFGYFDQPPAAYHAAIRAGIDSFTERAHVAAPGLRTAVEQGLLAEHDLDVPLQRILEMRLRLGDLEPTAGRPYRQVVDIDLSPASAHADLARQAARAATVLLKNERDTLPLWPADLSRLAVIGPLANEVLADWYAGQPPYRVTPLDGLRARYGADAVVFAGAQDRITLRHLASGRYLATGSDDALLRLVDGDSVGAPHCFDVTDWGEGTLTLRAAANARLLSTRKDGGVIANQPTATGWRPRETFNLVAHAGHWILRCVATGQYARVADDGTVSISAEHPGAATVLVRTLVADGADIAARVAAAADAAIVLVGSHPRINAIEGRDRHDYTLAADQQRLVRAVAQANPRCVAVIVSSYPMGVSGVEPAVPALVWTCHGGQEFGTALADVVCGDHSPAGRLPQTWYRSGDDLGDIDDYDIIKSGKTYLYFRGDPLYPFGHGLSYTRFHYGPLRLSTSTTGPAEVVTAMVTVSNVGAVDGDEVVQLYVHAPGQHLPRPRRQLHGLRRVHIARGQTIEVCIPITIGDLAYWDVGHQRPTVEPGEYLVMVGRSCVDIARTARLTVVEDPQPPECGPGRDLGPALVRAVDFDDYAGVRIIDEQRVGADAVCGLASGSWLLFTQARLTLPGTFVGRVGADVQTELQLRVDDPVNGALLATVDIPAIMGRYGWTTVECPLEPTSDAAQMGRRRDLYLVFGGPARIASFAIVGTVSPSV
jgi:beta-glucosidase